MLSKEECMQYLKDAQLVPPDCNYSTLAECLKNGAALCHLINILNPSAVPISMISAKPQNSKYLSEKNIEIFLSACVNVFKLPREALFEVKDLRSITKIDKVMDTIALLIDTVSKRSEYLMPNLSLNLPRKNATAPTTYDPHSIYSVTMEDHYMNYDVSDIQEEDIYLRSVDVQATHATQETLSTKERCIQELKITEEKYISVLLALIENFKIPLSKVLPQEDIQQIFLKIDDLYEVHFEFLYKLKKADEEDSRMTVAECFISHKEQFLLYGEYCSNVQAAQNRVNELSRKPEYKVHIEACEKNCKIACQNFRDLFIIPMQRILKYPLFLKTCIENTDKTEVEYKIFIKAFADVQDLAQYVNEVKRDYENINNIKQIENSIKNIASKLVKGTHLKDYGRLNKDGELECKQNKNANLLFLFDKVLLVCSKSKDGELLNLVDFLSTSQFNVVKKQNKNFSISNGSKVIEFKAKSNEEMVAWVAALELAKDNFNPVVPWKKSSRPPRLHLWNYKEITICDVCKKLLKGLFYQGYRCPEQNFNVHKDCIPDIQNLDLPLQKAVIPAKQQDPWLAKNIDRAEANFILKDMPNGTFMVRNKNESYVICVVYEGVQHIKVENLKGQLSIEKGKEFSTIQDLVQFYEDQSLGPVYTPVQTKLLFPYRSVPKNAKGRLCRARFDFVPPPQTTNQLKFRKGQVIEVVDDSSIHSGWCKGRCEDKIGLFEFSYVEHLPTI